MNGFENPYMTYSEDYFIDPTVTGQFDMTGAQQIGSMGFGGSYEYLKPAQTWSTTRSKKLSDLGILFLN